MPLRGQSGTARDFSARIANSGQGGHLSRQIDNNQRFAMSNTCHCDMTIYAAVAEPLPVAFFRTSRTFADSIVCDVGNRRKIGGSCPFAPPPPVLISAGNGRVSEEIMEAFLCPSL